MYSSRPMAGGLETQEKLMFQFKSEEAKKVPTQCFSSSSNSVRQEEFPLIQDRFNFFVLFRPSPDWRSPIYIKEDNLIYSIYQFKY